ncbi:CASP-like protein [Artemisia annua]|uniref:CASP-like protein n=1 Tax=Artemisia annua TaxID=35608 RepID=A0A2U1PYL6_ARTAN|nr:CASP-like protein [Artemisia annua]
MASNNTTSSPHGAVSMEVPLKTSAPPPEYASRGSSFKKHAVLDVFLRVVLFATALAGIILMVTAEQTKTFLVAPGVSITRTAKFSHSPAYIYFVAAMSVAALYGLVSGLVSVFALMKPGGNSAKLMFHFVILDALLLGIVASTTGASGGAGYIGLKGNSHSNWNKICNRYGSYCHHFAAGILLSLISAISLLLLVWLSVYVLSKKIARR